MKKTIVFIAIILTVMTATAAAADFHAGGYDDSCLLCQVNHLPLAEVINTPFIPESSLISWWYSEEDSCRQIERDINLATGRAPPFSK